LQAYPQDTGKILLARHAESHLIPEPHEKGGQPEFDGRLVQGSLEGGRRLGVDPPPRDPSEVHQGNPED
jgi:hypothetical protein